MQQRWDAALYDARHAFVYEYLLRPSLFHDGAWYADYRRLRVVALRTD